MSSTKTTVDPGDYFADELTTPAAVQIIGGASYTAYGIFNKEFVDIDLAEGVEDEAVSFAAPTLDLPDISDRDELTIDGTTYEVIAIQADAEGVTRLILHEQL